jgi:hypothetical protein
MSSSSHTTPEIAYTLRMDSQLSLDAIAQYAMDAETRDDKTNEDRTGMITTTTLPAADSTPTLLDEMAPAALNGLQAARDLHDGRPSGPSRRSRTSRAAAVMDRWAPTCVAEASTRIQMTSAR